MKPSWLLIFSFMLHFTWLTPVPAVAQVVINEVCSYNGTVLEDEDGDEPDWIELYNQGPAAVNLFNYALQAGNSEPWILPQFTMLPQEFIIIYASGKTRTLPNLHASFKLSKEGETLTLFNTSGVIADVVSVVPLQLDHSYGRKPDGSASGLGIFNVPSPGNSNQSAVAYTGYVQDPVFSKPAGFYNGQCLLEISTGNNATIRYTTDGSLPTQASDLYNGSISISSTTVIRASAFSNNSDELPSQIISNTYFLNYNSELPVFSISTNPEYFWDWNTGIYVSGPNASPVYPYYGANFWQDWEIPAHIEFFDEKGARKIAQHSGVSIHGGSSNRSKPMKSLRLSNKSKFGGGDFNYRFFDEKNLDKFKIIVLRNSSGDFNKTHFRDGCLHQLMMNNTNIDLDGYQPSVVFLNGIYYGVHNIRERISKYYLEENYGVDGENVDLLEEDSLVIEGSFTAFNAMHDFITTNNMAVAGNFNAASGLIDTESLCDYYIAETFLSNIDWPYNNIKFWRVREAGAKWRYILIDLDIALGNNGWAPADFDILGRIMGPYGDNNRHVQIFRGMLQNQTFREYFINRYADLVNTLFSTENMEQHILDTRDALEDEMPLHFNKWGNDMAGWDQEIFQVVMPHLYDRPAFAMEQVKNVFNLEEIVSVELDVWPPAAGKVTINTITPGPLPWKGNYFDGNPVTISVVPNPGFKFMKWVSESIPLNNDRTMVIKVNPEINNRFTAWFNNSSQPDQLMVYPNPSNGNFLFGFLSESNDPGTIEIINATGQRVYFRKALPLNAGINKIEMKVSTLTSGVYMLNLITEQGIKSARLLIL